VPGPTPHEASFVLSPIVLGQCGVAMSCLLNWGNSIVQNISVVVGDSSIYVNHTYTVDQPEANATLFCYNPVSSASYNTTFILQQQITGLQINTTKQGFPTFSAVSFNLSIVSGTHVTFYIDFGDGFADSYKHPNRLSYLQPYAVNRTYTVPGSYIVDVVAYNKYFSSHTSLTIFVQNPVKDYVFLLPSVLTLPPYSSTLVITPNTANAAATSVSCVWSLGSRTATSECASLEVNAVENMTVAYMRVTSPLASASM
jgi:hypothetical protein